MVTLSSIKHFKQSATEQKIRLATNSDPFGPFGNQLNELATFTFSGEKVAIIGSILQKRLTIKQPSKHWRSILKTFTVVIFLLQSGSSQFVLWAKGFIPAVSHRFSGFSCYDVNGNEIGEPVRSKIKYVLSLLRSENDLTELREKFHQLRSEMSIPGLKMYSPPTSARNSSSTLTRQNTTSNSRSPSRTPTNSELARSYSMNSSTPNRRAARSLDVTRSLSYKSMDDDMPISPVNEEQIPLNYLLGILQEEDDTLDTFHYRLTIFENHALPSSGHYGSSPPASFRSHVASRNPFFANDSDERASAGRLDTSSNNPFLEMRSS